MNTPAIKLPVSTSDGTFLAHYSKNGLAELNFPNKHQPGSETQAKNKVTTEIREWHQTTVTALKETLAGKRPKIFPPLDPAGTQFQKKVWRAMRRIPPGQTKSYGEVAKAIGKPKAVRAVGGACGANPIPVLVPCHRVLAANKKIGGFSSGLPWKYKLLELEGIRFDR